MKQSFAVGRGGRTKTFTQRTKAMWRKATTPHLWTWFRKPPLLFPMKEALAEERQVREDQIRCAEAAVSGIRSILTGAQFYRLRQYCIEGKTESEIAEAEGVTQRAVSKSLVSALKKRENF